QLRRPDPDGDHGEKVIQPAERVKETLGEAAAQRTAIGMREGGRRRRQNHRAGRAGRQDASNHVLLLPKEPVPRLYSRMRRNVSPGFTALLVRKRQAAGFLPGRARPPAAQTWRGSVRHSQSATRTTTLPKFLPSSSPMKAVGAFSRPSTTSSRSFTLPAATHSLMSRENTANSSA